MTHVVIVGAGVGGLVTAGLLARAGLDVTVLEAHIYPGGCAGTFYHQGYRFDAGATLPAGFGAAEAGTGGVMTRLGQQLGITWPAEPVDDAMTVWLPDGSKVTRWTDPARWADERRAAFGAAASGAAAERFWRWQEATADALWPVAEAGLPWPPATGAELLRLVRGGAALASAAPARLPGLLADTVRPVAAHLRGADDRLRVFADAQLLISAQATSAHANALYGAAALDLPRRGVAALHGGMGALGNLLAEAVRRQGGRVIFRHAVTRVTRGPHGTGWRLETNKDHDFTADLVIFNLPPWDAAALLQPPAAGLAGPRQAGQGVPADGWGAFVVYAGIDECAVPAGIGLHHQVVRAEPLGEGNSVFLTLSLPGDAKRAPDGQRAVTFSTHTALAPWWDLFERDRPAYEARKQEWTERVWRAAERVLPGLRSAVHLALPGTPVTFQRFTHRTAGWVGGFPQTSLARTWSPRLAPELWLVGDSIFPGQSTLAVSLGATRVVGAVLASLATQATHYSLPRHADLKG